MAFQNPSQTNTGRTEDFALQLARGHVANHANKHRFGFNPDVDATYEIIWSKGGSLTYPTTAAIASINSASGNSGSEITIQGLDANYLEVSDTITLDSNGDGSTTQTFLRINRAFVSNDDEISSDLDITVGGNVQARIPSDHQQTMQIIHTVPANKTAYLTQLNGGVSEKEKNVEMQIFVRRPGGVFRSLDFVAFQTSTFEKHYPIPLQIPEKSDIQLLAKCAGNSVISGNIDLIIIDGVD